MNCKAPLYRNSIIPPFNRSHNVYNEDGMYVYDMSYFPTVPPVFCQVCGGDLPYVAPDSLVEKHHFFKCEALHHFSSIKKMGGRDFCASYQAKLEVELNELWESFSKHNEVRGRNRRKKV